MPNDWEQFKQGTKTIARRPAIKSTEKLENKPPKAKKKFRTLTVPAQKDDAPAPGKTRVKLTTTPPIDDPNLLTDLQKGIQQLDATLDLHRLNERESHTAVLDFLSRAVERGWRYLLIITGRGAILRAAVPRWLLDHPKVRFYAPASRRHGGEGAFYVVVRKR